MNKAPLKAPALQKGDMIGIMAPSCWADAAELKIAKDFLEAQGYEVYIHPQSAAIRHQSAGTPQEKAQALNELFANPDIKAIITARGGNRAMTMLPLLDYDLIAANPKILCGYSDVTALLNGIHARTGLVTFHGPLARELSGRAESAAMLEIMSGQKSAIDCAGTRIIHEGEANGRLMGGNLSVMHALSGTGYMPDMTGALLFLEDTSDHLSRYDRMLCSLRLAGVFNMISGLVMGRFSKTCDDESNPFGFTLEDIVREHLANAGIPVVMDMNFGHHGLLPTYPVGAEATLTAKEAVTLRLNEPVVG